MKNLLLRWVGKDKSCRQSRAIEIYGSVTVSKTVLVSAAAIPESIVLVTNPITDVAKLKITCNQSHKFEAEWRNSQGLIETEIFDVSAGNNNIQLSLPTGMVAGTYYLRIISDDKKQRQLFRVIKQ